EDFESFRERGLEMVVRPPTGSPQDFVVTATKIHPAYAMFDAVVRQYCPEEVKAGGGRGEFGLAPAYDVALLTVDLAGRTLAKPLPIATAEELATLRPGDPIGYVGYPSEQLFGVAPTERPQPVVQTGNLVGASDFLNLTEGSDLEQQLVRHNLPSTGGASGSPILDAQGRVVALLNAGNISVGLFEVVADGSEGGGDRICVGGPGPPRCFVPSRVPSAAQLNFGQRVDLLREVLDGVADERTATRRKLWTARLEKGASCRPRGPEFWTKLTDMWQGEAGPAEA